jgi:hypothetical protein
LAGAATENAAMGSRLEELRPAEKSEEAVVEYLRSSRPVALTIVEPATDLGRAA